MQENNSIIIAMLEELLTISKSQRTEQTVNANVDLTPIKELIENGNRENSKNQWMKLKHWFRNSKKPLRMVSTISSTIE